jgi:hypothetical protein
VAAVAAGHYRRLRRATTTPEDPVGGVPVGKRPFHAFLSHAHVDRARADLLVRWLRDVAGVPVWFDADNLPTGAFISTALPDAIENSRSMILMLSEESVSRGWVQEEYSAAINHRTQNPTFRIIPVLLDDVRPPGFLQNYSYMSLAADGLDRAFAAGILRALLQPSGSIDTSNGRNVYVSRGWRTEDAELADDVCTALESAGVQLVGDAEDQPSWVESRILHIMEDCGAFAAILPYRTLSTPRTSKYVLREWELAAQLGLPCLVVADPRIDLPSDIAARTGLVTAPARDGATPSTFREAAAELAEDWVAPARSHYVFFATDFDGDGKPLRQAVKELVEAITAMPCVLGEYVEGEPVQREILRSVAGSTLVLADVSGGSPNVHVELGAARAYDVPVRLLRRGPLGRPAFMLRDQQVWDYGSEADLLGRVARISYPYRRTLLRAGRL